MYVSSPAYFSIQWCMPIVAEDVLSTSLVGMNSMEKCLLFDCAVVRLRQIHDDMMIKFFFFILASLPVHIWKFRM